MNMKIREIGLNEKLAQESSELYRRAKTKRAYEETIKRGNEAMTTLKDEPLDVAVPVILPGLWANHDLLLKFPSLPSMNKDREEFLKRVEWWYSTSCMVEKPENKIALLFLKSMILKNLLNNYTDARWCIIGIEKIIAEEKEISIALTLGLINTRGMAEMTEGNWTGAVGIFNEIDEFPKKILWQPENSKGAADILSNRGISLIHAGFNIWGGVRDLAAAERYYQQREEVPEECLENLRDSLKKAVEKM